MSINQKLEMQRILFPFCVCLLLFSSCKKNEIITGSGLIGKWKAIEQFQSPGNGGQYLPLPDNKQFFIEFKQDSSFTYSSTFPKADSLFNRFSVNGYEIAVYSSVNNKTDTWYIHGDLIDSSEIRISIFTCIEGCAYKLVRTK